MVIVTLLDVPDRLPRRAKKRSLERDKRRFPNFVTYVQKQKGRLKELLIDRGNDMRYKGKTSFSNCRGSRAGSRTKEAPPTHAQKGNGVREILILTIRLIITKDDKVPVIFDTNRSELCEVGRRG